MNSQDFIESDEVLEDLQLVTSKLREAGLETGYGLGGEDGYGAIYENEVFGMHPYCWCERVDCAWCRGCTCPDQASIFLVDGSQVSLDDYFSDDIVGDRLMRRVEEFECRYCKGEISAAPNFWHKNSRSWVSWYKYIGRGMHGEINVDWSIIIKEVLESIPSKLEGAQEVKEPLFGKHA